MTHPFPPTLEPLLGLLAPRLPAADRDMLLELWRDEEGLVADMLASTLVDEQIPICPAEFDILRDLLEYFQSEPVDEKHYPAIYHHERTLASLNVVDES